MKRTAKIVRVGAEKSGISQKTGMKWTVRELDIAWQEQGFNGEPYEQSACVQVHGELDELLLRKAMTEGTLMDVRMFFRLSANEGRSFTNIKCYLPEGYEVKPL